MRGNSHITFQNHPSDASNHQWKQHAKQHSPRGHSMLGFVSPSDGAKQHYSEAWYIMCDLWVYISTLAWLHWSSLVWLETWSSFWGWVETVETKSWSRHRLRIHQGCYSHHDASSWKWVYFLENPYLPGCIGEFDSNLVIRDGCILINQSFSWLTRKLVDGQFQNQTKSIVLERYAYLPVCWGHPRFS